MKSAFPWILTALGAVVAFMLYLNTTEKDYYENGSLTPVAGQPELDPVFNQLIPEKFTHSCPTCGECVHPVDVVRNERTLSLRDHDGWYKLFWAADEKYYFEEVQHLAACYENRTANDPQGTWTIHVRAGPATHAKSAPHECGGPFRAEISRTYRLRVNELTPGSIAYPVLPGLVFPYSGNKLPPLLHFGWEMVGGAGIGPDSCPCGKP